MIGRCDGTQSVSHPLFIKHLPLKLMKKIILLLSILTSLYFYCTARAQGYYPNEYLFYGSSVKCVDACRVERIALT